MSVRNIGRTFGLVVLIAVAGAAGAAPAPVTQGRDSAVPGMRVVRDPAGRFEISVPASWEVRTAPPGRGIVALLARANTAPGGFAANVVVTAEPVPAMTSVKYGQKTVVTLRNTLQAFRALSEGPAQVGGSPGYARAYTWLTGNGTPVYVIQAYLARQGIGLIATGSTRNDPVSIARDASVLRRIVLSLRAHGGIVTQGGELPSGATAALGARRDLFASPPGAVPTSGPGQASRSLPSVPSAGGVPLPPLPPATPLPPPPVGSGSSPASSPAPPLPQLAAVVMGPTPQAVLRSGGTYAIVHQGEHTSWGMVVAIRASAIVLDTGSGTRTISWSGGSQ